MTRARAVIAVVAATQFAGCSVDGAFFRFGPEDDGPSVTLAASPAVAVPGDTVGLIAAAADDYRVVAVEFYAVDDTGGAVLLGRDSSAPFALETVVAAGTHREVRYRARAVDDAGQSSESLAIAIAVH